MTENNTQNTNLLSRAFLFLEDMEWKRADEYAEKILDADPKNADAYLCKLLSEFRVARKELLSEVQSEISQSKNYVNALKYADANQKAFLENCARKAHAIVAERARAESVLQAINTFSGTIDAYRVTQSLNRSLIRRGKSAVIMYLITLIVGVAYVAALITLLCLSATGKFDHPELAMGLGMGLGYGFLAYLIILCIAHARVARFIDLDYDNDRGWSVPILFGMINIFTIGIWGLVQTVVTCKECKALKENNVEMDRQISNLQQQIEELQK